MKQQPKTFNEYMSFKTDTPIAEVIHNYFYDFAADRRPMVELHLREIGEQGVSTLSGLAQRIISTMSGLQLQAKTLGFSGGAVKTAKVKVGDVKNVNALLESNYFSELPDRQKFFTYLDAIPTCQQPKKDAVDAYYNLCDMLLVAICYLHFNRESLRLTWQAGREAIADMPSGIDEKTYGELSDAEMLKVIARMVTDGTWKTDPNDADGRAVRAWIRDNSAKRPEKVVTVVEDGDNE